MELTNQFTLWGTTKRSDIVSAKGIADRDTFMLEIYSCRYSGIHNKGDNWKMLDMISTVGYNWDITAQIGADISTFKSRCLLQVVNIVYVDKH